MTKYTIDLADKFMIRTVQRDGKAEPFNVVNKDIPDSVKAKVYEIGMRVLLTNVYNGGGKDASDSERLAAMDKKLDAWKRGEFNVTERGESVTSAWREVYLSDCVAAGMTVKAAEAAIKAKVAEMLPKDTKATFANYIEATAIELAKSGDIDRVAAREALEAYYIEESDRREKERAKTEAKVEVPKIDLSKFLKPKAEPAA